MSSESTSSPIPTNSSVFSSIVTILTERWENVQKIFQSLAITVIHSISHYLTPYIPTVTKSWIEANIYLSFTILCTVFVYILYKFYTKYLCPKRTGPVRGYGSGENNRWNRRIRVDRPVHDSKQYKLEHRWVYTAENATPDMDVCRTKPFGTVSATDNNTGMPLSGHLVGRQTWKAVPNNNPKNKNTSSNSNTTSNGKKKGTNKTSSGTTSTITVSSNDNTDDGIDFQSTLSFDPSINPNAGDKLYRAQLLAANGGDPHDANPGNERGIADISPQDALQTGWDFYFRLLSPDGHWAGDYGGPLFLLPGLVITCIISGMELGERKQAMIVYMSNHQQTDGGWGLHLEGPSTLFSSCLNYVALRLLGMKADDPIAVSAREFILKNGGTSWSPQWSKFYMAVLGIGEWDAVNPIPPELWLLPYWSPFHPGKMWCHSRMPYLPMSYIYGKRFVAKTIDPKLVAELRKELYTQPYEEIDWDKTRNTVSDLDLYAPHTPTLEWALWLFRMCEKYAPKFIFDPIRKRGCDFAISYVHAEDLHTNYIDIGPVNKVLNMLACYFEGNNTCESYQKHVARIDDYLWVAEDGMKMQGYNGSQLWDTAFATQALASSGLARRYADRVARIYAYLDASQIKEDVPIREKYFRTISKGGWPFSTNDHGWPIADCTSEGIKAALAIKNMAVAGEVNIGKGYADGFGTVYGGTISPDRFFDAVNVILAFHNPDGGWATYEETRGAEWYENFNTVESFGDIMIDYTYTELTSSSVQALAHFQRTFPQHRSAEVSKAIAAGVEYVRAQQRDDGSWYGSWAVCFTYGCWFGVKAIVMGGEPEGRDKGALEKCCEFLLSKQEKDGGWGESYLSCLTKQYSPIESTVVNTAWALLSLMYAQCPNTVAIRRGIDFLIKKQTLSGDWAQEWCSGIFNRTCAITYTSYRNIFPLWAIAVYVNEYKYSTNISKSTDKGITNKIVLPPPSRTVVPSKNSTSETEEENNQSSDNEDNEAKKVSKTKGKRSTSKGKGRSTTVPKTEDTQVTTRNRSRRK